ncbi:MAG: helix-turn-helix domain-containing protein [Paracoccus sp. (in: a-proteobacteria)]|uniref:MarR family winged helix-turn-helix transcriptional regulator n=1 Tax=Paracoccus sp. TaxID=267 RepID=UPI0039E72155
MTGAGEHEIERISSAMGRFRILVGRRVISRIALANVAPSLDISDLDVLSLVPGREPSAVQRVMVVTEEVSVGDIARYLRIDPSRASRLIADLVQQGFLLREAAQDDARRAVLRRSDTGDRIFAEMQKVKYELLVAIVGDWPDQKRAAFAESFPDFVSALEGELANRTAEEP